MMSRFDDRLTRGFDEIADRATPSPSAHANFRIRIAQYTPHEEVVIMMTPDTIRPRRRRWAVLTVAGASAALALLLVGIVVLRSDTDDTLPSTATAPSTFLPDDTDDTLPSTPAATLPVDTEPLVAVSIDCQSFTAADLEAIVGRAQVRVGTDFTFPSFVNAACYDTLEGIEGVWNTAGWHNFPTSLPSTETPMTIEVGTMSTPVLAALDEATQEIFGYRTHPMLDDSVLYQYRPNTNPAIRREARPGVEANLWIVGRPLARFSFDVDVDVAAAVAPEQYETVGFAIADEMLRHLGWID